METDNSFFVRSSVIAQFKSHCFETVLSILFVDHDYRVEAAAARVGIRVLLVSVHPELKIVPSLCLGGLASVRLTFPAI